MAFGQQHVSGLFHPLPLGTKSGLPRKLDGRRQAPFARRRLARSRGQKGKLGRRTCRQDWAPTMRGNHFYSGVCSGQRTESDTDVNINSLDCVVPSRASQSQEGTRRLLATGDSTIYGFKVRDGRVYRGGRRHSWRQHRGLECGHSWLFELPITQHAGHEGASLGARRFGDRQHLVRQQFRYLCRQKRTAEVYAEFESVEQTVFEGD